jgi:phosphopantetheine adenylyltransferase
MSDGTELMHYSKGSTSDNHKYITRTKDSSGKWVYTYQEPTSTQVQKTVAKNKKSSNSLISKIKNATGYTAKENMVKYTEQANTYEEASKAYTKLADQARKMVSIYNKSTVAALTGIKNSASKITYAGKKYVKNDTSESVWYNSNYSKYKTGATESRQSQMTNLSKAKEAAAQAERSVRNAEVFAKKYYNSLAYKLDTFVSNLKSKKSKK